MSQVANLLKRNLLPMMRIIDRIDRSTSDKALKRKEGQTGCKQPRYQ